MTPGNLRRARRDVGARARSGVAAASLLIWIGVCSPATAVWAADLPDPSLTPGAVRPLTRAQICTIKWGVDARHVTAAMKRRVFASYGLSGNDDAACVPDSHGRRCEIDHLISRELGGDDVVANLWPQAYGTHPWNAVRKDRLENRLHKELCAKHLTLGRARQLISNDWRKAYVQYFGEP